MEQFAEKYKITEATMEVLRTHGFDSVDAIIFINPSVDLKTMKIAPLGQLRLLENGIASVKASVTTDGTQVVPERQPQNNNKVTVDATTKTGVPIDQYLEQLGIANPKPTTSPKSGEYLKMRTLFPILVQDLLFSLQALPLHTIWY